MSQGIRAPSANYHTRYLTIRPLSFRHKPLARIQLLDQLKERLWSAYGEEIVCQEYALQELQKLHEEQLALDFEDQIPF